MSKPEPNQGYVRKVAEGIARRLFTNGFQERATRLIMYDETKGQKFRDLGGWSEKAAADQIENELIKAMT